MGERARWIQPLAEYAKAQRVGFGGPDIYPSDPQVNDPRRGVYRLYAPLSGVVPLGAAVQQNDYTQRAAFRGPPGETPYPADEARPDLAQDALGLDGRLR